MEIQNCIENFSNNYLMKYYNSLKYHLNNDEFYTK